MSALGNYNWTTLQPSTFAAYSELTLYGLCGCACDESGMHIYLMDTSGNLLILVNTGTIEVPLFTCTYTSVCSQFAYFNINSVSCSSGNNGKYVVVTQCGVVPIYLSSDFGQSFTTITTLGTQTLTTSYTIPQVLISSTGMYILITYGYSVYLSSNYGSTFTSIYTSTNNGLVLLAMDESSSNPTICMYDCVLNTPPTINYYDVTSAETTTLTNTLSVYPIYYYTYMDYSGIDTVVAIALLVTGTTFNLNIVYSNNSSSTFTFNTIAMGLTYSDSNSVNCNITNGSLGKYIIIVCQSGQVYSTIDGSTYIPEPLDTLCPQLATSVVTNACTYEYQPMALYLGGNIIDGFIYLRYGYAASISTSS